MITFVVIVLTIVVVALIFFYVRLILKGEEQ